jgi:hypothetical protein
LGGVFHRDTEGNIKLSSGLDWISEQIDTVISQNPEAYMISDSVLKRQKGSSGFRISGEMTGEMTREHLLNGANAAQLRENIAKAHEGAMSTQQVLSIIRNGSDADLQRLVMVHDNHYYGYKRKQMQQLYEDLATAGGHGYSMQVSNGVVHVPHEHVTHKSAGMSFIPSAVLDSGVYATPEGEPAHQFFLDVRDYVNEQGYDLMGKLKRKKDKEKQELVGVFHGAIGPTGMNVATDIHSVADVNRAAGIASQTANSRSIKNTVTAYVDLDIHEIYRRAGVNNVEQFIEDNIYSEGGMMHGSAGLGMVTNSFLDMYDESGSKNVQWNKQRYLKRVGFTDKTMFGAPGINAELHYNGEKISDVHNIIGIGEAVESRGGGHEIARQQSQFLDEMVGGGAGTQAYHELLSDKTTASAEKFQEKVSKGFELVFKNEKGEEFHRMDSPIMTKTTSQWSERATGEYGEADGPGNFKISNMKTQTQVEADLLQYSAPENSLGRTSENIDSVVNSLRKRNFKGGVMGYFQQMTNIGDPTGLAQQALHTASEAVNSNRAAKQGALAALEELSKLRL